jgi:ABC-type dipeptide/oligopeptide/nickel transport system ATPase subunit
LGLSGRDVLKRADTLSGGERAKCLLAKLMVSANNYLLLDEPGNALDVYALEALEALIQTYPHGILLVSHDRRMVEQTAARVLRFDRERLVETSAQNLAGSAMPEPEDTLIRMRMAALSARIAQPAKGEDVQALRSALDEEAEKLRALKR